MGIEIDLHAAIYARLADQITGSGSTCSAVYDYAPEGAAYPYVAFGQVLLTSEDAQIRNRFDALVRLHTWGRAGSSRDVKAIQGDIYTALNNYSLTIANDGGGAVEWVSYSLLRETSFTMNDPDGAVHGVCEYRVLIHSA